MQAPTCFVPRNQEHVSYRSPVIANFLIKFSNFRYCGDRDWWHWSETNFTYKVKFADPENICLVPYSRAYRLYKPSYRELLQDVAIAGSASPVLATIGMSVCPSVRPSHTGTEWKRRKLGSRNLHRSDMSATRARHHSAARYCWHCCKGDERFQWEMPFFGVCQLRDPLTDFHKNWHSWLRRGPHPTCKNWGQSVQRRRVYACVKLSP